MEPVIEVRLSETRLVGEFGRLEARVALAAVAGGGESVFAAVAGAAGFSLLHVGHGVVFGTGPVGEEFRVAIGTLIHAKVEVVAEGGVGNPFDLEWDRLRRCHPLVALAAVAGDGECFLVVVTGTAGFTLPHLGHGHVADTDDVLVAVASAALAPQFGNVHLMLEDRLGGTFHLEDHGAGLTLMTANALRLVGNAEGFYAGMACAA